MDDVLIPIPAVPMTIQSETYPLLNEIDKRKSFCNVAESLRQARLRRMDNTGGNLPPDLHSLRNNPMNSQMLQTFNTWRPLWS